MKIKKGYKIMKVAQQTVVFPTGNSADRSFVITLNSTAEYLWRLMHEETTEAELVRALCASFDVEETVAEACVHTFVAQLAEKGFLEEAP